MVKVINEYDNEFLIGRVGKVEVDGDKVKLGIVENYDVKDAQANWVNVTGFKKTATNLTSLNEKELLKGSIVAMTVRVSQNGDYTNRGVNSFKIVKFPAKKE